MAEEMKPEVKTEETKEPTIEELSAKVKELEGMLGKQKDATSKASSDAATWKEKYRATLDDAKRKEEEQAEAHKAMADELAELRTEKRISTYTAKFLEQGYDAENASKMAASLPDGVGDDFWAMNKAFLDAQKQLMKTQAINSQPNLPAGMPPSTSDEDKNLRRMFGLD